MRTLDHEVLQQALHWCQHNHSPWLCTIVHSQGSAPRPLGSMLTCLSNGQQVGSVSGGCVEDDLLERLHAGEFDDSSPQVIEYGVSAEQNERLGLPCGGRLHLLLQRLGREDEAWLDETLQAMEQRRCIEREYSLISGDTTLTAVEHFSALEISQTSLRQCFGPRMRMLLVGAGQLAQNLAELALAMDYEVLVTDTRQQLLSQWDGPELPLIQGMPDDVVRAQACDKFSVVITLTHDPRIDDMALMEALGTDAWYVGALGSPRTTQKRLARLKELEIPENHIARLHAPVGLAIGSKTPIEIAVAIMAELTQLRRHSQGYPDTIEKTGLDRAQSTEKPQSR
jgi:xanthine dehydrogenase accessory factor